MQISESKEEAMDLWNATLATGYEPYTDEFDVVMDVEQLVPVERVKRIASFLGEYGEAKIERLELPEHDPIEYMIASQREDKDDLLQGVPRGQGRRPGRLFEGCERPGRPCH